MASSDSKDTQKPVFLDASKRRKWYFRSGTVVFFIFLLLALGLFAFGLAFATQGREPVTYQDVIQRYHYYYSGANTKKVALTFDDGPNPPASEDIMNALKAANAPATFFYIGRRALVRPDVVKQAAADGFDVEDYSFTHSESSQSSYGRLALELDSTGFLLQEITGKAPTIYRPLFLEEIGSDPTVNPYIPVPQQEEWMMQAGYMPVGSDLDTNDWLATTPQQVINGLTEAFAANPNGHIILLHDVSNTAAALPGLISYLRQQGYSIVPLAQLLTPPQDTNLTLPLALGDIDSNTGGQVSQLQWFLYQQKYLDAYALSGTFDKATHTALVNFQIDNHLVNPANPDPSVVGITGAATRALIYKLAPGPTPTISRANRAWWSPVLSPLSSFVLAAYTNLFPMARNLLGLMVIVTLTLVGIRTLGLVLLLLYRWYRGDAEGETSASGEWQPVSFIIPAYNEQENIAATLESVLAGHYRPREVIVVDDGSTDSTADEVRGVIERYPEEQVRLITVENGGKARALNIGVEESRYEFIFVLDADAVLDPDAVRYMMPHFSDPRVGAVAGKVCTTNAHNLLNLFQKLEYAIGQNIDKTAFTTVGAVGVVPGPAGAWRRSFVREAGGFHTDTLVEDQEMTLAMLYRGKRVIYEPRAIAYTETPDTVHNFLKQRFRWVYGTMQCFWKYKKVTVEQPFSVMSLVVMPNVFVYNILLPLTYPFADSAFVFGLIFGEWQTLVLPFCFFTAIDLVYALWGVRNEPDRWKLMLAVPLQRIVYRQLLYYTVYKGFIRAVEGTGTKWNKFSKMGETRRFYMTAMAARVGMEILPLPQLSQLMPEEVMMSFQGPVGTSLASTNRQEVMSLSVIPGQFHNAGETSSSPFGPASSR